MAGIAKIEQYVIDKVREMRQAANLSQADIAVLLETSEGVIGDIESTSRNAKYSIRHLNELAKVFKCSPKDFLPDAPFEV
jgi:transcriptional regulator with XRE-family HTH domain